MRIDLSSDNDALVHLDPGDRFHFVGTYLRGRSFGIRLVPPCPLGSPIGRIMHGCYWMNSCVADDQSRTVRLTGPTVIGRFSTVRVPQGHRHFVNPNHLAGFLCRGKGKLHTKIGCFFSPTMWSLGHPLPIIADGPVDLVFYGEGMRTVTASAGDEYIPSQVVCYNSSTLISARALNPDSSALAHVSNAVGRESRWVFAEQTELTLVPINRPTGSSHHFFWHVAFHLAVLTAMAILFKSQS